MTNLESIKAALQQARENAGAAVVPANETTGGAVATVTSPGRPVTVHELLNQGGSMQVKAFLKVEKLGFLIGKDDKIFKEFQVEFHFDEVQPFFGLRYGQSPAKYERSVDRQVNQKNGKNWAQCIADAQRLDPRCRGDYAAVDIPFTVLEDIKGEDGKVLVEKGEKIGWTSSITNFYDFKDFSKDYYDLIAAGALPGNALVRGKIVHDKRKGGNGDAYGALKFVDFDVILDEPEAQAA